MRLWNAAADSDDNTIGAVDADRELEVFSHPQRHLKKAVAAVVDEKLEVSPRPRAITAIEINDAAAVDPRRSSSAPAASSRHSDPLPAASSAQKGLRKV